MSSKNDLSAPYVSFKNEGVLALRVVLGRARGVLGGACWGVMGRAEACWGVLGVCGGVLGACWGEGVLGLLGLLGRAGLATTGIACHVREKDNKKNINMSSEEKSFIKTSSSIIKKNVEEVGSLGEHVVDPRGFGVRKFPGSQRIFVCITELFAKDDRQSSVLRYGLSLEC